MDFFLAVFSVSGVKTWVFLPPLVAFIVSFFTSMGGVSGAFLLLPFQMSFLGYTNPSVSATNQLFNIVAIPSGVYRYCREGRMVWPLTWVVVAGSLLRQADACATCPEQAHSVVGADECSCQVRFRTELQNSLKLFLDES